MESREVNYVKRMIAILSKLMFGDTKYIGKIKFVAPFSSDENNIKMYWGQYYHRYLSDKHERIYEEL